MSEGLPEEGPESLTQDAYEEQLILTLAEHARNSFLAYFLLFQVFNPELKLGRLHDYLIDLCQRVSEGRAGKRLAISVPPQHGKTLILSKMYASWIAGRTPGYSIGLTSFDQSHATEISVDLKDNFVESIPFKLSFPDVAGKRGLDLQSRWELSNGVTVRAKGAGSKFTGRRIDLLIIDDPHKGRKEAESKTDRNAVRQWYFGDLFTRLSPGAVIMIVATRWHPEDLIGHLTSEEYTSAIRTAKKPGELYRIVKLPAIATGEEDPLGRQYGEALAPELGRDLDFLESVRAAMSSYEWSSQFQQDPHPSGSGQVETGSIQKISESDLPGDVEWVWAWDLANSIKTAADFSVGVLGAYSKEQKKLWVADVRRFKMRWPVLKERIRDLAVAAKRERGLARIGVEGVSGFGIAVDELRALLNLREIRVELRNPPNNDGKFIRALRWFNLVENGGFHIVGAPWNKDYLFELANFPDGDHDDQVDATSILYEMTANRQRILFA